MVKVALVFGQQLAITAALLGLAFAEGFARATWLGWLLVTVAVGLPVFAAVDYFREDRVSHTNPLTVEVKVYPRGTSVTLALACTNPSREAVDDCRVVLAALDHWDGAAWRIAKWFLPWAALAWADSAIAPELQTIGPETTALASVVQIGGESMFPHITWVAPPAGPVALGQGFYRADLRVEASPRRPLPKVIYFWLSDDKQGLRHVPDPIAEGLTE
jgi:hypothetical protein